MAPRNAPKHFLILALLLSAAAAFAQETALDRYVKQRDPVTLEAGQHASRHRFQNLRFWS
jgi:hypothetical protein